MKKAFQWYIDYLFSGYKFYRKKIGGRWYLIQEDEVSGFAAGSEYWARELPKGGDYKTLKIENFSRTKCTNGRL
jgi:hypothetical protein